jgi:MoaA/NifB/PqqE/SkfB family radical SAM enzyme
MTEGRTVQPILIPAALQKFIGANDFERYKLVPGRPAESATYLQIELTNRCNLSCAGCVRALGTGDGSLMSVEAFENLLAQLPDLRHVSFVGAGEALIVRNFADFVRACSERHIFSSCNTNGALVRRRVPAAIEAGLGLLAVSVDAADDVTLALMRDQTTVNDLRSWLADAVTLTEGSPTEVSAAVTLGAANYHRFADIVALIADCGVRRATVESVHHWGEDKALNTQSLFSLDPKEAAEQLERGLWVALGRGVDISIFDYRRLAAKREDYICPWPWDSIYVTRTGQMTPCCVNIEATPANTIGDLRELPVQDIWRGENYANLRDSFMKKVPEWPSCDGCVYRKEFGLAAD